MIKKILLSVLSIIGLTLSFSNALNIQDQQLGTYITNDLNFIPNPLDMESSLNQLSYKYGRTDEGYIYLGIESNYNGFQNLFGTVRFNYNDQYCSNTVPNLDFYDNVANGTFIPTYFSIISSDYTNTENKLIFCDDNNNCYYSCCKFYNNTSTNITYLTCGQGSDNVSTIAISISDVGGAFPVNNSPYSLGGGTLGNLTGGIELNSTESALNYFENYYGWNKNICYVGIDNITTLWGSSVPFQEGSGLDIFEVFEGLYGNTDLYKMYPWLNSWIINYTQRSLPSEDRLYLANYNSGTNQVDLYYDNLTFPFTGKPVALYFMADEVSYFTNNQTMGSDVVSYCYIKLKGGTYEDIIDNSTKQSIDQYTEKSNTNKGFNPDGTIKNIDYSQFGSFEDELPFSGNTSVSNTLKNFFDKINDQISGINISTTFQILPSWVVSALLIVVLFRIIRKK